MSSSETLSGAQVIAKSLQDLGVKVVFGIVGIPVIEVAESCINLGIRFIGFRNEQAAGYAATAYGYLTGKPGVYLVVGGPGVLHAVPGVSCMLSLARGKLTPSKLGNSSANAFPMLMLAGSNETHLTTKGAFQELDAVALLTPLTKLATRPSSLDSIPRAVQNAYRAALYGRPGSSFVDLPADYIQGRAQSTDDDNHASPIPPAPRAGAEDGKVAEIANIIRSAKAPLIVLGKGAAYARAEECIRELIDATGIPFLPSPMGKGIVPDSHPTNASSARSAALRHADVVLLLGARLNWIFHFGQPPKWNPEARFIQIDIHAEEIGKNGADAKLGIVGDVAVVVPQLSKHMAGWKYDTSSSFTQVLKQSRGKNESRAAKIANMMTGPSQPLRYERAYQIIKEALHSFGGPESGNIVYVAEGANTMDISRSAFPVEYPRLRLDAGTHATMGVGLGYAIAAHEAYNAPDAEGRSGPAGRKKIVAFEGDSAFGFSGMEVETMARYGMDVLIFVMNNGGVYHGDSDSAEEWTKMQQNTLDGNVSGATKLRSTSLGYEVRYEKLAEACGGKGYFVRTEEELARAAREGYAMKVPVIVNVVIASGKDVKLVSDGHGRIGAATGAHANAGDLHRSLAGWHRAKGSRRGRRRTRPNFEPRLPMTEAEIHARTANLLGGTSPSLVQSPALIICGVRACGDACLAFLSPGCGTELPLLVAPLLYQLIVRRHGIVLYILHTTASQCPSPRCSSVPGRWSSASPCGTSFPTFSAALSATFQAPSLPPSLISGYYGKLAGPFDRCLSTRPTRNMAR